MFELRAEESNRFASMGTRRRLSFDDFLCLDVTMPLTLRLSFDDYPAMGRLNQRLDALVLELDEMEARNMDRNSTLEQSMARSYISEVRHLVRLTQAEMRQRMSIGERQLRS